MIWERAACVWYIAISVFFLSACLSSWRKNYETQLGNKVLCFLHYLSAGFMETNNKFPDCLIYQSLTLVLRKIVARFQADLHNASAGYVYLSGALC